MRYKRILVSLAALLICTCLFAQQKAKPIAPFKITLVTGKAFASSQLQKKKETILIYFSPTCGHCKELTKELIRQQKKLLSKQVVMITNEPLSEVKAFDAMYSLSVYPNIKIGTEGNTLLVQQYYNIQHFPFVASYSKKGKLLKILPHDMKAEEMVNQL